MRVTWNAINALLQSDWSAQHSGLGHENLSRVPRPIFPCGFPRPLVIICACVHVGKIRLARETTDYFLPRGRGEMGGLVGTPDLASATLIFVHT